MSWLSRLRNALHPKRLDSELLDEMSDHLQRRAADLREKGLSDEEASREASLRFGNVTQLREQSREIRLASILETTLQDLRYAARGMRKSAAFAITAILSLALAIGANTAVYSIVDAALLRPLPVPQPDRLFTLATPGIQEPGRAAPPGERETFNYPLYKQFRAAAGDSARLALFSNVGNQMVELRIPDAGAPIEKATRQFVSGDAFDILKVPPAIGRVFTSEDDRIPWGHLVAVISYDYWTRRFHSDPEIVGKRIHIPPRGTFTIIGVAKKGFFGVESGRFIDIWLPAMMYSKASFDNLGWNWFWIVGRLAPGVAAAQLQPRLQPLLRDWTQQWIGQFPTMPPAVKNQFLEAQLRVHPGRGGHSAFRETFARPLWIVLAVAAGILLIACANIASLLLARSTARASEMAMRISLGAGRSRLIRQLLTESLLLSILAGALGWLLAIVAAPTLIAMLSTQNDPVKFALAMDTRVLLFCMIVSTLAAVFFGLLPAWQASGARPMRELRGVPAHSGKLRWGQFFVGVQVAFAFCLIVAGAGFLFTLRNLFAVNLGFEPHNISMFMIGVGALSDMTQKAQLSVFIDDFQKRVAALPGIQSAATAQWELFDAPQIGAQVIVPGKPLPDREEIFSSVSPGYFTALKTPLLAGRDFEHRDRFAKAGPRPAIVNQALAKAYFDGQNPIGKIFQVPQGKELVDREVVGLVADSAFGSVRLAPQPIVYGVVRETSLFELYVRSPLDLGEVKKLVDRATEEIGYRSRVMSVTTLDTLIGNTLLREKLLAGIGGVFAFLGLLLAAIGLFGLLNYSVIRRTREIGIRAALGARPPALVFLVLRDMFSMIAGGLIVGLAGSLALMTFVRSLLFGIRPLDPLVITTAAAVFLAAAFLAGGLPASRAARIDPMVALRHE
jgi:predicted permease